MTKITIVIILICVFSILCTTGYANETSQSTQGDQSPAIFSPGGTVNVTYQYSQKFIDKTTETARNSMREEFSNCLKVAAEFQAATLDELNVKLSKHLIEHNQVTDAEAEEWAHNILLKAPKIKQAQKEFEDTVKKYNEEISKMLVTSSYNYITNILGIVDSKFKALQELDSEIAVERYDKLLLFSDERKSIKPYVVRKLNLPGRNYVEVLCFPGKTNLGLVVTCPTIQFAEVKSNVLIQKFLFTPIHATGRFESGRELPYKDSSIKYKDVMYPVTGPPSLDEKIKNEFEKTFNKFFQLAYGNQ